jgi:hypothetical protein
VGPRAGLDAVEKRKSLVLAKDITSAVTLRTQLFRPHLILSEECVVCIFSVEEASRTSVCRLILDSFLLALLSNLKIEVIYSSEMSECFKIRGVRIQKTVFFIVAAVRAKYCKGYPSVDEFIYTN